jgi:hypothetical protein
MRHELSAVALAALVLIAGCAGAPGVGPGADGETTTDDSVNSVNGGPTADTDTGTVRFYISDERNAIGEFKHLNVTVTRVGLHRGAASDGGNETEDSDEPDDETTANGTTAVDTTSANTTTNATTETTETAATTVEIEDDEPELDEDEAEAEENETDDAETETDEQDETDDEERSGWVTHDVDNRTIDLTEYRGANATLLENLTVPNGTYDTVFVYVSGIDATLDSGESVNVKLPSSKLHLNTGFTVGNGESVDFVFDITVFKAGNSGKYILKPVVSESGTDVPIETPDREDREDRGERGDDRADEARDGDEREDDDDDEDDRSGQGQGQGEGPPGENRSGGPEARNGGTANLLSTLL